MAKKPASSKPRAPEQTLEEVRYLKHLVDNEITIHIKLEDNEEVEGVIEYWDHSFIRINRDGDHNLFIFKHDIKYFYEVEA